MKITKIEETNLEPLWTRATCGKKYPELLSDPKCYPITNNKTSKIINTIKK